jgi:hypothetical protein
MESVGLRVKNGGCRISQNEFYIVGFYGIGGIYFSPLYVNDGDWGVGRRDEEGGRGGCSKPPKIY